MRKTSAIIIREFTEADAEAIAEIYNHYVVNTTATFELKPLSSVEMRERLRDISSLYPCLVAIDGDGVVIGYCYAHLWKGFAAYSCTLETTVYLRPDAVSQGVGRMLMASLIDACRQRGTCSLIACITAENDGSIRFHESLGFERVSHFRGVGEKFGRMLDVIDLQLRLK